MEFVTFCAVAAGLTAAVSTFLQWRLRERWLSKLGGSLFIPAMLIAILFWSLQTWLSEADAPPPGAVADGLLMVTLISLPLTCGISALTVHFLPQGRNND